MLKKNSNTVFNHHFCDVSSTGNLRVYLRSFASAIEVIKIKNERQAPLSNKNGISFIQFVAKEEIVLYVYVN